MKNGEIKYVLMKKVIVHTEARLIIRDRIKQKKPEWKGALRATHNTGKGLHKVFSTTVKEISQELINLRESGSEVSHLIPEPRNFAEVTKLSERTYASEMF